MDSLARDEGSIANSEDAQSIKTALHDVSRGGRAVHCHTGYIEHDRSEDRSHSHGMNGSLSGADVGRLNDTLRASGLAPLRREADLADIIECAVNAVSALNHRNQSLLNASYADAPAREVRAPTIPKAPPRVVSEPVISVEDYQALLDENRRVSLIAQRLKTESNSMERSLRLKSEEVERLSSRLQSKFRDEDHRAALAMSAIRDKRMPTNTLLVIENYQKQISSLESDKSALVRRTTSLAHRLKILEDDRQQLQALIKGTVVSDAHAQNIEEECDNLKECMLVLETNLAQKNSKIQELEQKYFEQVEQNHFSQKHVSASVAVSSLAGLLGTADDPPKVVEKIKKMQCLITGVFPIFEAFVRNVVRIETGTDATTSSEIFLDAKFLDSLLDNVRTRHNHSTLLHTLNARLNQVPKLLVRDSDVSSVVERVETLIKAASCPAVSDSHAFKQYKEIVHDLVKTLGTEGISDLAPVAHRIKFRIEEYGNFYRRLCNELGLGEKAPFSQVIDKVTVQKKRPTDTKAESTAATTQPARFRMFSSDSEGDLALSREIIKVSRK